MSDHPAPEQTTSRRDAIREAMVDTGPATTSTEVRKEQPIAVGGFVLLLIGIAAGVIAGLTLKAQETNDGFRTVTELTVINNDSGGFNWLLFSIFTAAGMVSFAICLAAGAITKRLPDV